MEFLALFTVPSFWFDMICLVLLIVFCARYVQLGFLSAVVQIFGTVISIVGAHIFATFADTPVYEFFFQKIIEARVEDLVLESEMHGLEYLSQSLVSLLPDSIWALYENDWSSISNLDLSGNVDVIVQSIMESTVAPIVTQIIFMVLFFVGFFVCRVLVFLLVKALRAANYIPVLGSINRILGWVFGVLGGCVDMFLALCLVWVVMLLTDNMVPVLNTVDLARSYFFDFFQTYNPLV